MSQQNIREYNFRKWFLKPAGQNLDVNLASDERNYNEEVVFSPFLIAQNDGNRLPLSFDLNNSGSSQLYVLNYGFYNSANTLVSLNYYNPNNDNLDMFTASTLCDIGLTAIDNGLVTFMSGETMSFTMGLLDDANKFNRLDFDRRLKLFQVTGYTNPPNSRFSGNTDRTLYEIVSKTNSQIGTYNQLYGGFYQGFFKLFGYDYETFPNRTNKGWSVETLLKPRLSDEFGPTSGETTLNLTYPNNKNTFFYFGTRGENKFYHHASGSPESDSGYTRVTQVLEGILKTCACDNTGVTNSRCIEVYNPIEYTVEHNVDCDCSCSDNTVMNPDKNPLYDSMSNVFALRLSGEPTNPKVCVKVLKLTGDCVVTGITPTTGITYQTGYTITEYCSESNIYDYCSVIEPNYLQEEHWFLIDAVWERNTWFDNCDLYYKGGLGLITDFKYVDSLSNNTVNLIEPPITHTGSPAPAQVEIVNLNERWLIEKSDRLGALKIYVNGKLFYVINGFEEIIPRGLNTEKEKQLGVPFNISWGGGTQGLRESLTFDPKPACDISFGVDIGLDLLAIIIPGSINIQYILTSSFPINEEIVLNFTHVLGTTIGTPISINSSVTIPIGSISGETFVTIDEDYGILNGQSSFTNLSIFPSNLSGNISYTTESEFISPTPTVTPTTTITPTTQCYEYLTDELGNYILTEDGNYIISELNPCITPTPTSSVTSTPTTTPTQTVTPTNPCIEYLTDELGNFILTEDGNYIISELNPCITPTPTPSVTKTLTTTPTNTPTQTNTSTPTITQTPSQAPLYPLTLYIQPMNGGQSIIFDGITYTGDTTVNILLGTFYSIEAVPIPGYAFAGWNIYGGSFSSTGQSTTVAISLTSGANLAPSYNVDPNYDALEGQMTTNLVNYQNAEDNNWVTITQQEYNNIFNNVDGVIKIGNSDEQVNTRELATGFETTTFGTIDANTPLTIPTGYYVVGFVAESWNQNGQVQLGYTTTYHTGSPTYMSNSPNVIGGATMFYVRKRPSYVEGAPASQNLYPVLNFIAPAYPNAVLNTYGWQTSNSGVTWFETNSANQTAKIQILLTNVLSWPAIPPPSPSPTVTQTPTLTPTPTPTPTTNYWEITNCNAVINIIVNFGAYVPNQGEIYNLTMVGYIPPNNWNCWQVVGTSAGPPNMSIQTINSGPWGDCPSCPR